MKGVPNVRQNVERAQPADRHAGRGHVRLEQVADVRIQPSPAVIKRDAAQRYVDVEANVSGRSLSAVAADVEDRLADSRVPTRIPRRGGRADHRPRRSIWCGLWASASQSLIAIFLLFQAVFRAGVWRGWPHPAGGSRRRSAGGAHRRRYALSLGALIAFLALLGIAARNGVMLIDRFQQLRLDGTQAFGAELVRRGALERFATLTVAVATAAAVLPFVIMGDIAGLEIVNPMAIVMLGGLITSTFSPLRATGPLPAFRRRRRARTGSRNARVVRCGRAGGYGDRGAATSPALTPVRESAVAGQRAAYQEGEGGSPGRRRVMNGWASTVSAGGSCAACAGLVLIAGVVSLSACGEASTGYDYETASHHDPAELEPIKGTDVQRVIIDAEGVERVGLQTAPIRQNGQGTVMPHDAVIYDADGETFTYTAPSRGPMCGRRSLSTTWTVIASCSPTAHPPVRRS